jgi:hypothetical protein
LWLRYLIARYDAFASTAIWTLMNEYEHYPGGPCRAKYVSNQWAMRTARWVKATAPHGHVVAVHNGGPRVPSFAERFAADPGAIDAVMFQDWGSGGDDDGWLAAGIEDTIAKSFAGWQGSAVFAEWGYERNPDLPITFPWFKNTDAEHNRRGAWRGAFCGMGVVNGFENTWGPVMDLENDQEGVVYFEILQHFFTDIVPFQDLRPAPEIVLPGEYEQGHQPLALATNAHDCAIIYMPVGGMLVLDLPEGQYHAEWFDPRNGECCAAAESIVLNVEGEKLNFIAQEETHNGHPADWVLILRRQVS